MPEPNSRKLYLAPLQIKVLFGYYLALFLAASSSSCGVFIPGPFSRYEYIDLSFIGACSMACLGSSVYYTRKLYKGILSDSLCTDQTGGDLKRFATFVYFFARPLFAVAFAILVVIGTKSGLVLSGGSFSGLNYGFVQLNMFFSFFVGFLSGRFIRQLEAWGERVIERLATSDSK